MQCNICCVIRLPAAVLYVQWKGTKGSKMWHFEKDKYIHNLLLFLVNFNVFTESSGLTGS